MVERFREYGLNVGLAFQITDDIIDIVSNSSETGKTQGKDKIQAKNTYPLLWGMEKSRKIAREKIDEALDALDKTKTDSEILKNIAKSILVRRA
jgi:geranylgeranyl diphosphate synthase type II